MKKHRWLPYVLAAVVMAACYGGIEVSQLVMDDFRGEVEEISEEREAGTFYLDYRESDVLWPWDLYEAGQAEPVTDPALQVRAENLALIMMEGFSGISLDGSCNAGAALERIPAQVPDAPGNAAQAGVPAREEEGSGRSADDAEMQSGPEDAWYDPAEGPFYGDIYLIHDYKFVSHDGGKYVLNLAFSNNAVLYYMCVPADDSASTFEDINGACEYLNYQYFDMRGGYVYDGGGNYEDAGYENCFLEYMNRLDMSCMDAESICSMPVNAAWIHAPLIESGNSSGIYSDGRTLSLELYDAEYRLVMFFSPTENRFVGFSLREA